MSLPVVSSTCPGIRSSRLFAASREQVYTAFSDPSLLTRWWGPRGFTSTLHVFDLQPGGRWHMTLHGPEGAHYPNEILFTAVTPGQQIIFDHLGSMHRFLMSMDFTDEGGGCRLSWHMQFEDGRESDKLRHFIIEANEQNFDRLEVLLAELPSERDSVLQRSFAAPCAALYGAWTQPERLAQWWGPHAFTNPVCDFQGQADTPYRMVMRSPDGEDYPLKGQILVAQPPRHLVFTMDCSEHPDHWQDLIKPARDPEEDNPAGLILTSVTIVEETDQNCRLIIRQRFESEALCQRFLSIGMHDGWNESLDSLAALLAPRPSTE